MRILSQDGMIDFPYETVAINIWDKSDPRRGGFCVYAHSDQLKANAVVVAKYSSQEKAQKAMEMLRTAYAGRFITNADISEDFNEQLKELMKGGFGTVLVKDGNYGRVEFNNLNGYFQFPADDELEG